MIHAFNNIISCIIALAIVWKCHLINDAATLAQDRMDMWIGMGVAFILFRQMVESPKNR